MPGDEIKRIDWKALARSDRYYVKEFEEETTQKTYILLDSSASMGYHKKMLIPDLWDGSSAVLKSLKHFRHLKHEVLLFHVLDNEELVWPFSGELTFEDMETGERIQFNAEMAGDEYRQAVNNWREQLNKNAVKTR